MIFPYFHPSCRQYIECFIHTHFCLDLSRPPPQPQPEPPPSQPNYSDYNHYHHHNHHTTPTIPPHNTTIKHRPDIPSLDEKQRQIPHQPPSPPLFLSPPPPQPPRPPASQGFKYLVTSASKMSHHPSREQEYWENYFTDFFPSLPSPYLTLFFPLVRNEL